MFNLTEIRITEGMATFQALQTWIGHDSTRYHNVNALPHALPYILSQFNMDRP